MFMDGKFVQRRTIAGFVAIDMYSLTQIEVDFRGMLTCFVTHVKNKLVPLWQRKCMAN